MCSAIYMVWTKIKIKISNKTSRIRIDTLFVRKNIK
ncbi:hypothetical protein SISI_0294 [Candidatus Portiera aleyrodidarum]|uniref:Uncharacterized protein n=1 Tax=Candidatus Portiera aleyrodidarum TaxID=91844 RepID=A0A6S6S233_9GAMM|nr:hypothetical protein SISI_0294 [Candidatus Portiera aleyrodidarum]